jgi:hypothetical protein
MVRQSKWDYFKAIYWRYRKASHKIKSLILDEFCRVCGYQRKYAIRKLNGPPPEEKPQRAHRSRGYTYSVQAISVLAAVWEAAGYPWSVRLKALLPVWMPWIRQRFHLTVQLEQQLLAISPRQIDRRLKLKKRQLKKRIYGRTKPGTLLKHHIPIRTDNWDVHEVGFVEVDLVSHSGNCAEGDFVYSLNVTDILSTWVETQAVMGKGRQGVVQAFDGIAQAVPFAVRGMDSDNGSEFINAHLVAYCQQRDIQFTRGRPYKKDDNAHIEQKNWTHVRKLMGWDRYDSRTALDALNDLYRHELRLMMNLFQPSVKLSRKVRVGSRLTRKYEAPQTPLDRLIALGQGDSAKIEELKQLRERLDPFELAQVIEQKLERIWKLANHRQSPKARAPQRKDEDGLTQGEREALHTLSDILGVPVSLKKPSKAIRRVR